MTRLMHLELVQGVDGKKLLGMHWDAKCPGESREIIDLAKNPTGGKR